MDALTSRKTQPIARQAIEINGILIYVSKNTTNVYLAQARIDPKEPEKVSGSILTTDLMFAWTWLFEGLADGGWGEVVVYDVATQWSPRWHRSLGRIDGPTKYPYPLRHTTGDS